MFGPAGTGSKASATISSNVRRFLRDDFLAAVYDDREFRGLRGAAVEMLVLPKVDRFRTIRDFRVFLIALTSRKSSKPACTCPSL